MGIKKFRPITPSRRFMSVMDTSDITSKPTVKSLLIRVKQTSGRNNNGRITSRHKQTGAKKLYRIIDFKRNKFDIEGIVSTIEYDPYRNCRICLVNYVDGEKRYILKPSGLNIGDKICSANVGLDILPGNAMSLINIPIGTMVHNIEMKPGKGAQIARSAGTVAQIIAIDGDYATLRLKSGETRKIFKTCRATIGEVGNSEHNLQKHGKAGAKRWLGVRPTVRGVAMNPIDHPHGGGEGKTSGGRDPVSPWGTPTKGYKTRSNKRTDNLIVRRRVNKKNRK